MASNRASNSGTQTGTETAIDTNLTSIAGRAKAAWDLFWFGPGQPPPQNSPAGTDPRGLDYPFGVNLQRQPKQGEGITFQQLRNLSRSLDVLRVVIETRKDQMSKKLGCFRLKPDDDELPSDSKLRSKSDPRVQALNDFIKFPDKEHTFETWLRMLLEDMFVLDAPAIWLRPNAVGELHSLRLLDGATIVRKIDETAATPTPPNIAYQQMIKGMVADEFTTEQLVYMPRNPSTDRIYGYSPVEQIVTTILIGLRRMDSQLKNYTHGNIPMALLRVPDTWNAAQIRQAQVWFDQLLSGNQAQRSKAIYIPNFDPVFPQKDVLKDDFDEWIARIVCYVMSVSPTPFVKQVNRATADNATESAQDEGQEPTLRWVASVLNFIAQVRLGFDDVEWFWGNEEAVDPFIQAEIDNIYVTAKILHPDEIRERIGKPPLTTQQKEDMTPTPLPVDGKPQEGGKGGQTDNGKGNTNKRHRLKGQEKYY